MKEIPINYFSNYKITNTGRIYNTLSTVRTKLKKPRELKTVSNKNTEYKQIVLRNKNVKPKNFYIHRLVALTYIPNPENKPYVNHINGNKFDNRVENLEWCTAKENSNHYVKLNPPATPLQDKIINNKKLLNAGLKLRKSGAYIKDVANLWNCSKSTARTILIKQF